MMEMSDAKTTTPMSAAQFVGQSIRDLAVRADLRLAFAFPKPTDRWEPNDRPVLALACFRRVPKGAALYPWQLFEVTCGGFLCDTAHGTGLLLRSLPEPENWTKDLLSDPINRLIADLWGENFTEVGAMDYPPGVDDKVMTQYRQRLVQMNITWSKPADRYSRGHLKQAIYPMDATDSNLRILTGDPTAKIDSLLADDPTETDAWLVVLGQNCD
jgi:hypothetical protein